jgi:hypothetical protein
VVDLVEHPLGVHLRQRHEDYLLDHGLGYSSIKQLYLEPTEWWEDSPHNLLRRDKSTDDGKKAYRVGAALHTNILDGERVYERTYAVAPTRETHPEALDTVTELAAACDRMNLSTRGSKPELVRRLVQAKCPLPILVDLQEKFALSGKKPIDAYTHDRIRIIRRMMMRTATELKLPDGDHLTLADALKGALTEVSIYWVDENGIRQRARFDALKPNITGDLKSITNWKRTNFKKALLAEVILRGYMIQEAHYHEARVQLRKAVAEGRVFGGTQTERKKLERIARSDHWAWLFIFAKMDGAAQTKGMIVRHDSGQSIRAQQQREEALANFLYHREFHGGIDVPWFDPEVVWEPAEDEWPLFSVIGQ